MRFRGPAVVAAVVTVATVVTTMTPVTATAAAPAASWPWQFVRVAGSGGFGYTGDGGPATAASLSGSLNELKIAVASDGTLYIADWSNGRVRAVGPDGVINTVAGSKGSPSDVAVGPDGSLYVSQRQQIQRIGKDGKVTVLAGHGGDSDKIVDGDRALDADVEPRWLDVDGRGNVYFTNGIEPQAVYRVDRGGTITRVAGGGKLDADAAQGKPARDVELPRTVQAFAVDKAGTVYIGGDDGVYGVGADGKWTLVTKIGNGDPKADGVGGLTTDQAGALYIASYHPGPLLKVAPSGKAVAVGPVPGSGDLAIGPGGVVYSVNGNTVDKVVHPAPPPAPASAPAVRSRWPGDAPGTVHTVVDGRAPTTAEQEETSGRQQRPVGPYGVAVGPDGTVYVAEPARHQVRAIGPDGTIRQFAGTGQPGKGTDGGPAVKTTMDTPISVAAAPDGTVYIADNGKFDGSSVQPASESGTTAVRRVRPNGTIDTVSGANHTHRLAVDKTGRLVVTTGKETLQRFDGSGHATTLAGAGKKWAPASGPIPAAQAGLPELGAVTAGPDGTVYFVELAGTRTSDLAFPTYEPLVIRAIRPNGTLDKVTGSDAPGDSGFAGDGGLATRAELNQPNAVAAGPDGSLYLADTYNNRIRRIDKHGVITTVAGSGALAENGDGGPATKAALHEPDGIAVGPDGSLYVTSTTSTLVRRIGPDGTISTLANLGPIPPPASPRPFDATTSLTVGPDEIVYTGDSLTGHAIRPDGTIVDDTGLPDVIAADGTHFDADNGRVSRWRSPLQRSTVALPDNTNADNLNADVAVGPDDQPYVLTYDGVLYRVTPAGVVQRLAAYRPGYEGPGKLAVAPDGTAYVVEENNLLRVEDGTMKPVTLKDNHEQGAVTDVAIAADGTVFISSDAGIDRIHDDGGFDTIVPRDGDATPGALAFGPSGDLYYVWDTYQLRAVVRPAAIDPDAGGGFPWLWVVVGVVVVAAAGAGLSLRKRRTAGGE